MVQGLLATGHRLSANVLTDHFQSTDKQQKLFLKENCDILQQQKITKPTYNKFISVSFCSKVTVTFNILAMKRATELAELKNE